jgi:hypothetical protein
MKTRFFTGLFASALAAMILLTGCPNPDNKIPPNCFDGILNNGEQLIDCGGPCEECDHCIDGIFQPDLGETWLDCGGECGPCDPCANGIQDTLELGGDETGVDCGGTNCGPCGDLCGDGLLNGNETQIDCNEGPYVDNNGNNVYDFGDVYTGNCQICPSCSDGIMNGTEIGVDCGGTMCQVCANESNCTNNLIDGDEFWTDCGGTNCPDCMRIVDWTVGGVSHTSITYAESYSNFDFDVTGTTITDVSFQVKINEPASGWIPGIVINLNPSVTDALVYLDANGTSYSTTTNGASGTFTLIKFTDTPAPGYIRGSFTGTLKASNGATVNITNGLFQVKFQ